MPFDYRTLQYVPETYLESIAGGGQVNPFPPAAGESEPMLPQAPPPSGAWQVPPRSAENGTWSMQDFVPPAGSADLRGLPRYGGAASHLNSNQSAYDSRAQADDLSRPRKLEQMAQIKALEDMIFSLSGDGNQSPEMGQRISEGAKRRDGLQSIMQGQSDSLAKSRAASDAPVFASQSALDILDTTQRKERTNRAVAEMAGVPPVPGGSAPELDQVLKLTDERRKNADLGIRQGAAADRQESTRVLNESRQETMKQRQATASGILDPRQANTFLATNVKRREALIQKSFTRQAQGADPAELAQIENEIKIIDALDSGYTEVMQRQVSQSQARGQGQPLSGQSQPAPQPRAGQPQVPLQGQLPPQPLVSNALRQANALMLKIESGAANKDEINLYNRLQEQKSMAIGQGKDRRQAAEIAARIVFGDR